jgi:hypothetical protein
VASSKFEASLLYALALTPNLLSCLDKISADSLELLKVKATLHPFLAKVSQMDLPIPLLPPVIIATFDSSNFII